MAREYIFDGERISVSEDGKQSKVINFKDDPSMEIEEKIWEDSPNRKVRQLLIHWGGVNPKDLIWRLTDMRSDKGQTPVASHISIDKDTIVQHGDFKRMGSHAKGANRDSIGVDINQEGWRKSQHEKRGKVVEKIPNPILELNAREAYKKEVEDHPEILSLNAQTAQTLREFILDMHEAFDIPLEVPRDADGNYRYTKLSKKEIANFNGILGHFHTSEGKWDPLPWWQDIMDPLFAAKGQSKPSSGGNASSATGGSEDAEESSGGGGSGGAILLLGAAALGAYFLLKKRK